MDWRKGGGGVGGGGFVGLEYTFVHDILALSMFKCAKKKNNKTSDSIVKNKVGPSLNKRRAP